MSNIVIFEDQTLAFTPSDGLYLWQSPVETPFTEGTKFIVIWDGMEYTCISSAMSLNGLTGVGIGNKAIIGIGEDTGEPFVFGYIPAASSVGCYTASTEDSHIVSLYEIKEDVDIVLKDRDGNDQVYEGVEAVKFNTSDGGTVTFIKGEKITKSVDLDFSEGDMTVTPEDGQVFSEVTIAKPENLAPENIRKDVDIAGIVGTHEGGSGINATELIRGTITELASDDLTSIGAYGLNRKESLVSVDCPKVTDVETYAFDHCTALESLNLPALVNINGTNAFAYCNALKNLYLPELEYMTGFDFYYCSALESVNLPKWKTYTKSTNYKYCFGYCSNLKEINAPVLTAIPNYCFVSCTSLTDVIFPKATSIGEKAFQGCTNLKKVDLPIAYDLGIRSFYNLTALETLILRRTNSVVSTYAGYAVTNSSNGTLYGANNCYVYVPSALVDSYKADSKWSAISSRIRAIEDYPDICGTTE